MELLLLALSVVVAVASAGAGATGDLTGNDFVKFTSDENGAPMVHVTISIAQLLPHLANHTGGGDIDVGYTEYNATLFQKIAQDLAEGTLEVKAGAVVSVLFGREFIRAADSEMDEEFDRLTWAVKPWKSRRSLLQAPFSGRYVYSTNYPINFPICSPFLSCQTGAASGCSPPTARRINQAPRSLCQVVSNINCCLSWSNYYIDGAFFPYTWNNCYSGRSSDNLSCQGYGRGTDVWGTWAGGVCLSNRATGCTDS